MADIENRMVVDSEWPEVGIEIREKISGAGYKELGTGIFVAEEDALRYAIERVLQDEALKQELVEWFYSGNWTIEEK